MAEETISIILPTHNGQRYLLESIRSCLDQTYPSLEVVVVNDGSTDDTQTIIDGIDDPRLRVIPLPENKGIVEALNRGFAAARGDLLSWTSDDNYYAPEAMAVMRSVLVNEKEVDFVYAPYWMVDARGRKLKLGRVEPPAMLDEDNYVGGCFLYRRRVYEALGGFNPEAFLVEDYEYWLRVRARFVMKRIETPLYYYRLHEQSLTARHGQGRILDQVERFRDPYLPAWKRAFLKGKRLFYEKDPRRARAFLWRALRRRPWHYPSWRLLIKSLAPVDRDA